MPTFSKLKLLRHCICTIKQYKQISTQYKQSTIKRINGLKTDIQSKILYSSVLDQQKLNLGYIRNKILEDKKIKREKLKNIGVKPLPVSLKLIGAEIDTCSEAQSLEENDEILNAKISEDSNVGKYPDKWMRDYEFFDDDEQQSATGTPDPSIPPSKIPCNGCGAFLQCADTGLQGYIPSEIFKGRTDEELKRIICQRCHFLKEYDIVLDVNVTPKMYIDVLSTIKDKFALAILIIDLLDFPCSIWPGIQGLLGNKRPIFVVGNKVDLLPKDSQNYLNHIKYCLSEACIKAGLSELNIKHVCLISAKTGYGIEELITQLHKNWNYKGDVYLVGCTNVGKSSLFNALLRSDYCKVQASDLIQRATTCVWPGTTLRMLKFPILRPSDIRVYERFQRLMSERAKKQAEDKLRRDQLRKTGNIKYATLFGHIGQTFKKSDELFDAFGMPKGVNPILTLDEKCKDYVNSKWCYDTPGVIHADQIHHLLTTEELLMLIPKQMITPRVFRIKPQMSLFLAGLARFDFVSGNVDALRISVYSSLMLPIVITHLKDATEIYEELLGSEMLGVPKGDEDRLDRFPKLVPSEYIEIVGEANDRATCDITLSSPGWIGLNIPLNSTCKFQVWTPEKRGIHIRKPSLLPYGDYLRGQKIRGSLGYKLGKPFIK